MALSPTAEGFRAAFRRPSLTAGEIAWRWVTGATAAALFFFAFFEFLKTLPVSNGELLLLRSRHPYLVEQALAHIFRGSMPRVVMSSLLAAMLLALLWMIAGAVGRIATVRGMLDYFWEKFAHDVPAGSAGDGERDVASNVPPSAASKGDSFHALFRLHFLRLSVALASIIGFAGATILVGFVSTAKHPRPGLSFLLFLPVAGLISLTWSSLNWLLSLAGMFAVRDGEDAIGAISGAVSLCRERSGAVAAVSTWSGLAHAVAFVGATTVVSMPLAFVSLVPGRLVVAVMIVITLAYFAVADWLYTARLAGYVCIVEMPETLLAPPVPPRPAPTPTPSVILTTIDRDEPILSDVPMPAIS